MPAYAIIVKPSADRALQRLPKAVQWRIVAALKQLAAEPRPPGVKKLAGAENLWRLRAGDYRIVYEIHEAQVVVLVLRIAHRKDVYRE
jgi:mRNA interferase RelE/StbE